MQLNAVSSAQTLPRLSTYGKELLSKVNNGAPLEPNQRLKITAYRDFNSGLVVVDLKEKEFENLKTELEIREEFDFVDCRDKELAQSGAALITFADDHTSYTNAGFSETDIEALVKSICPEIPSDVRELLKINPEEILKGCLDLRPSQPLSITGSREQLPQMLELARYAYKDGTKLVKLELDEKKEFDYGIPFYNYANDIALNDVPEYLVAKEKEILERNVADLIFDCLDPTKFEGIDPERIQQRQSLISKKIREYRDASIGQVPYCFYNLPSTASAIGAGYTSLKEAAIDAIKINRTGHFKSHIEDLRIRTDKLNALVKEGYRTLYFISVKPGTEIPDGKTSLKVVLTPKSIFCSIGELTKSGQFYVANVPSEENWNTPDCTKTEGIVSMTRSVSINGTIIDGIKMEFKDGKVIKASATKNEEVLLKWLEKNENADRLGEVALVAGSPIFDLNRVFNNILVDENATCHIALGDSYSCCIEGADDITSQDEKRKFLASLNCNNSPVHIDFMIGGPDVMVLAEKPDGTRKLLIQNNKFEI